MNKEWMVINDMWYPSDTSSRVKKLTEGRVYMLEQDDNGKLYLKGYSDGFTFSHKVYGLEEPFINKALKAYHETDDNFGMLLTGIKGTGKTLTGKEFCNRLGLPVILINKNYPGIVNLLSDIQQDVVIFCDEFEKVFGDRISDDDYDFNPSAGDTSLLSVMSGTLSGGYRKTFILTTNKLWINENLLNRPGRLRYFKTFGDLTLPQVNEIIEDLLINKEFTEDIISFLKPLKIITVDIVKAIIIEVNIFKQSPFDCCNELNIEKKSDTFSMVAITEDGEEVIAEGIEEASMLEFINTRNWKNHYLRTSSDAYLHNALPKKDAIYFHVHPHHDSESTYKVRFEKVKSTHSVFAY